MLLAAFSISNNNKMVFIEHFILWGVCYYNSVENDSVKGIHKSSIVATIPHEIKHS